MTSVWIFVINFLTWMTRWSKKILFVFVCYLTWMTPDLDRWYYFLCCYCYLTWMTVDRDIITTKVYFFSSYLNIRRWRLILLEWQADWSVILFHESIVESFNVLSSNLNNAWFSFWYKSCPVEVAVRVFSKKIFISFYFLSVFSALS